MSEIMNQLEMTVKNQLDLIQEMKEIRQEVTDTEIRVTNMVEKLSREITINYEEQNKIKSVVFEKSTQFARDHLEGLNHTDQMFKAWKGVFTGRIYSRLKERFNVVRYTALKREEFDQALSYLEGLDYNYLSPSELKPTFAVLKLGQLEKLEQLEIV